MDGGYRIQGRSTLRTEVPGQGIAAVTVLGKPSGAPSNNSEAASFNLYTDVESAPSASSAIFAVAIVRRPEVAFTLISHAPAKTPARRTLVFAHSMLPRLQFGKYGSVEAILDTSQYIYFAT